MKKRNSSRKQQNSNLIKLLKWSRKHISASDADWIIASVLKIKPYNFILYKKKVHFWQKIVIKILIYKRKKGVPLNYILGTTQFYGYEFKVNRSVLIPRPETEELIDLIIKNNYIKNSNIILDIGTGSGIIPIILKKHYPEKTILAIDISSPAIRTARYNAKMILGSVEAINFKRIDINNKLILKKKAAAIISNPPYIKESDYKVLNIEVKKFEPEKALLAGKDGLFFFKRILAVLPNILQTGGDLYLECGYDQAKLLKKLYIENFKKIFIIKDMNQKSRFIICRGYENTIRYPIRNN